MKRLAFLSNITIELLAAKMRKQYEVYLPTGYDTWIQEVLTAESVLNKEQFDVIFLILDGTEARDWQDVEFGRERIESWKKALEILVGNKTATPIFVSSIDIRENRIKALSERYYRYEFENEWYDFIQSLSEKHRNVYVMNLHELITDIGRNGFYSNKMWYLSNCPYSKAGMDAIHREINILLSSLFEARKKVLVLDLDNTLWGGVAGEDGISGILLSEHKEGQRYYDFQRMILEIRKRGVLLAIDSKNNINDVKPIISEHPSMLIREEDITVQKINWNDKAQNIFEIIDEINITEAGFVFIDDNPVERENVKANCREVVVPSFPEDTSDLIEFAEDIWKSYFCTSRIMEEDLKRNDMYKAESRRKLAYNSATGLEDYLKSLQIEIHIHEMCDSEIPRVVQLINKTNQFNLTTVRYSQNEIEELMVDPTKKIFVACSRDKYGENGLVSVLILSETLCEITIDTFLMSCRVMGRRIENVLMDEILNLYSKKEYVNSEYIATSKNEPVRNLYESMGFELIDSNEKCKIYRKNLKDYVKHNFDGYKVIVEV